MNNTPVPTSPIRPIPISVLLREFLQELNAETFSVQEFINRLGDRSFGILLLLMALPNALMLAVIPFVSTVFGAILVFVSVQMVIQKPVVWLPRYLSEEQLSKKRFLRLLDKSQNVLTRIESYLKPRWHWLNTEPMERIWGLFCLVNGLFIMLPIWFANFLPGWAIVFFALGILTKDGLYLCVGIIMSLISWAVLVGIYGGLFKLIQHVFVSSQL